MLIRLSPGRPISLSQNGITCISPRAPADEMAKRLKLLSTSITASTISGLSPARVASWCTVRSSSTRNFGSGTFFVRRCDMSISQTSASKRSAKLSVSAAACLSNARSSGSTGVGAAHAAGTGPSHSKAAMKIKG